MDVHLLLMNMVSRYQVSTPRIPRSGRHAARSGLDTMFVLRLQVVGPFSESYCLYIDMVFVDSQPTTTKTTTMTTTTTAPSGPSPTQTGIVKTCTSYYKAQAGDTCETITKQRYPYINSIPLFVRWNPAVGDSYSNLWTGYYYCVATKLH
jgi:hypothetical protein